jgi:multiple sugar transport system permease protein
MSVAPLPAARARRTPGKPPGQGPLWAYGIFSLLCVGAIVTLLPIVWMALTAFKTQADVLRVPPSLLPERLELGNLRAALEFAPFGRFLLNSLIQVGGITILQVATSALAAYAFARLRFRGRDLLFLLYLATLMIPPQVTLMPTYVLIKQLGWIDTFQGLIVPQAFTALGVFLLRQFFLGIPRELEDAARIDGAGRLTVLRKVILPLATPALASLAVFAFTYHWNNLLWPLVVSNSEATTPVIVGLQKFQSQFGTQWNLLMAAALITTLPAMVVYTAAQRWFVQGITMGGFGGR